MAGTGLMRNAAIALAIALPVVVPTIADAGDRPAVFRPGAPGVGDPYFPLDGNGGYDVRHYDLDVKYDPSTDVLQGVATIKAVATQNLSAFNLDLQGLEVHSVKVNSRRATFSRDGNELTITPRRGLRKRRSFVVVVRYSGVPETIGDFGPEGFIHTDDGALIVGQPHVAATWFPVNDHPVDAASYSFDITVPAGLEAIANGALTKTKTRRGWTTWSWSAKDPMASYLVGVGIGEFEINAYRAKGIRYWDAVDPDLLTPLLEPISGSNVLVSGSSESAYQRLTRTIAVPAGGATLTFSAAHDLEPAWDFLFVEAHTVGLEDWTTLPAPGITSTETDSACPYWLALHPFLLNYQSVDEGDGMCRPFGAAPATGSWNAATGLSGWQQWTIDLGAYAGSSVEVAITYAGDDIISFPGVAIDDIVVSTGEGTTSFEDDGDTFDGWTIAGPPPGSPTTESAWSVGTAADLPAPVGAIARGSFARQPEIIEFLTGYFSRYPWKVAGGIVDDLDELTFALENQTRPIYSAGFFDDSIDGDLVVVHELAHQWFGDLLRLAQWRDIWLNEGFATYAEWLWTEREGHDTVQGFFDFITTALPASSSFWTVPIGDPGPDSIFHFAVYMRGAMTMHALRLEIGDGDFFSLLRRWARTQAGDTVTTAEFIALAERVSGQQLDEFFDVWLYTPSKPAGLDPVPPASAEANATASTATLEAADTSTEWVRSAPPALRAQLQRLLDQ